MAAREPKTKTRLLEAASELIGTKGYAATTVDDICQRAGVTKGSFFHHFKSKDDLAIAATEQVGAAAELALADLPSQRMEDPLDRVLGWIDFQLHQLSGPAPNYSCLLSILSQETFATNTAIRAACDVGLTSQIAHLARDIDAAKQRYAPGASWKPESIGYFVHAVLKGSLIFAKARLSPDVARANLEQLRTYLLALFGR